MSDKTLPRPDEKASERPDGGGFTVVPEKELAVPPRRPHQVPDVVQDKSSGAPSTNNPGPTGPFKKS